MNASPPLCFVGVRVLVTLLLSANPGCSTPPHPRTPAAITRVYTGYDDSTLRTACASLLQDLGFTIEVADSERGLLVGSKRRTAQPVKSPAEATAEFAAQLALVTAFVSVAAMSGFNLVPTGIPNDDPPDHQLIRATLTVRRSAPERSEIALALHRVIHLRSGKVLRTEPIPDLALADAFFTALSKSAFLTVHSP